MQFFILTFVPRAKKIQMLLLLIIISLAFFTLFYCTCLTIETNRAHGFNSTRSQGLAGFKSNMAAGLSNFTKELGFFM